MANLTREHLSDGLIFSERVDGKGTLYVRCVWMCILAICLDAERLANCFWSPRRYFWSEKIVHWEGRGRGREPFVHIRHVIAYILRSWSYILGVPEQ